MKKKRIKILELLRFKYNVIVLNERTLEELFHVNVSRLSIITTLSVAAIVSFTLIVCVILFTPLKHFIPGFEDVAIRERATNEFQRIDSLSARLQQSDRQLEMVKRIIAGDIELDSIPNVDSVPTAIWDTTLLAPSQLEQAFTESYEEKNAYNATTNHNQRHTQAIFAMPVKGVVSKQHYPQSNKYGITMLTQPNDPVLATMEGDIIAITKAENLNYTIIIQHSDGYVSVYHNLGRPLRTLGDHVAAGESIALAGTSSQKETQTQIGFEIWRRGRAIDPAKQLVFDK